MGLRGTRYEESGENHIMRSLIICTAHPNIVRVIKSRIVRWAGHVARMGEMGGLYRVWGGNLRDRDHLGDLSVDGRIILRWIFRK